MNPTMVIELIHNAALLLGLGLLYDMLPLRSRVQMHILQQFATGLLLGAIGVAVMLTPWRFTQGIVFDTRTVLLSLAGLFFGPVPTVIAMVITALLRLSQGGAGMIMGVLTILSSGLGGIAWGLFRRKDLAHISPGELFLFGLGVHILVVLDMFALPSSLWVQSFSRIAPLMLTIHPTATLLLGMLLARRLERKYADEILRESEERYRTTLMSVGDGVIATDAQGRIKMLNPLAEALTGWQEAEAVGRPLEEVFKIVSEDSHQVVENPVQGVLRDGRVIGLANHTLLRARDGQERPIADSGAPIRNSAGAITGVVLVFRDQTEERAALNSLHESEERYRLISENAGDVIWLADPYSHRYKYISPSVERLLGYSVTEMMDRPYQATLTPTAEAYVVANLPQRLAMMQAGDESARMKIDEIYLIHRDGSLVATEIVTTLLTGPDGQVTEVLGATRDIRPRKRAEEALRQSEAHLKIAQKVAHVGSWTWHIQTGRLEWSDEMFKVFGLDREHFSGKIEEVVQTSVHPDDRAAIAEFNRLVAEEQRSVPMEYRVIWPDGTVRVIWGEAGELRLDEAGRPAFLTGVAQDITERKQAEEARLESEARWQFALEGAGDGVWDHDLATDQVFYSNQWKAILGYSEAEIGLTQDEWLDRVHPDDRERVLAETNRHLAGETPICTNEYRMLAKDGSYRWILDRGKAIHRDPDGRPLRMIGTHSDITARKQAEEERRTTIEILSLINAASDFNELLKNLLAYLKKLSGCEAVAIRLQDGKDYPYFVNSGFPEQFIRLESRLCAYDPAGEIVPDGSGNPILECVCGAVIQGRTNPSQPFFTPAGSFWTNSTSELLASPTEAALLGRTRNRCNTEGFESVALVPLRSGDKNIGLIQLDDPQPGRFNLQLIAQFERLADNIATFLAKKQVEQQLRASRERFEALYEYSPVPIWEEDFSELKVYLDQLRAQGVSDFRQYFEAHFEEVKHCAELIKVLDVNQESVRFFKVENKQALIQRISENFVEASWDSLREELIALSVTGGTAQFSCELPVHDKYGELKIMNMHLSVVPGCEETLERVMVSFWDITERKQAEEQLRASLKEKEILLRELYHRTKNNMQVIRSMLVLQSAESENEEVQRLVQETDNRIQSMALVHQMLYQSQNLSSIELDAYLQDLSYLILSSYPTIPNRIRLDLDLEPVSVTIDAATPLGLIINELLSNACKHAFPDNRLGRIRICLKRLDDDSLWLEFADDGVSVPEGFDLRNQKSYGLQSVFIIAERQLNGQVAIETRHGLAYTIRFADKLYQRRV